MNPVEDQERILNDVGEEILGALASVAREVPLALGVKYPIRANLSGLAWSGLPTSHKTFTRY